MIAPLGCKLSGIYDVIYSGVENPQPEGALVNLPWDIWENSLEDTFPLPPWLWARFVSAVPQMPLETEFIWNAFLGDTQTAEPFLMVSVGSLWGKQPLLCLCSCSSVPTVVSITHFKVFAEVNFNPIEKRNSKGFPVQSIPCLDTTCRKAPELWDVRSSRICSRRGSPVALNWA